jgi:hypothetical protein
MQGKRIHALNCVKNGGLLLHRGNSRLKRAVHYALESLEGRRLLCVWHVGESELSPVESSPVRTTLPPVPKPKPGPPAHAGSPLSSLPALTSRPGAYAKLYLDFNGDNTPTWGDETPGVTPAYDADGDATTFSETELTNIATIWGRVAEKFSPFNLDVTTVDPGTLQDGRVFKIVVGGYGAWLGEAGGVAYVDGFTNTASNVGFVFSGLAPNDMTFVGEGIAHEAGHGFGLYHQGVNDASNNVLVEYSDGDATRVPIMGNANNHSSKRGMWWNGPSNSRDNNDNIVYLGQQDDLSRLARAANGFGYRPDDIGDTAATALPMSVSGNTVSGSGLIGNTGDADCFSFTTTAGRVSFTVLPYVSGGMLDAQLELRDASNNLLASASTSSASETLTADVAGGSYRIVVKSQGNYGDVGQFAVSGLLPDRFENNDSLATATNAGVAPGVHLNELNIDAAGDDDWYKLELLRPDSIRATATFSVSSGNIDLQITGASGTVVASGSSFGNNEVVTTSQLSPGTYYIRVFGAGAATNAYALAVDPAPSSATRVFYVNDNSSTGDRYTNAIGSNANSGLSANLPKATIQSILNEYDVGENDLIVVDTGTYSSASIGSADEAAAYAGSPGGSVISATMSLTDADFNLFYALSFANGGISINEGASSSSVSNTVRKCIFSANSTVYLYGGANDVIRENTFSGSGSYGVYLSTGGSANISSNTFTGRSYGVYASGTQSRPVTVDAQGNAFSAMNNGISLGYFSGASQIQQNNTFTNIAGYGVEATAGGIIQGNQFDSVGVGVYSTSTTTTVYNNSFINGATGISGTGVLGGSSWQANQANTFLNVGTAISAQSGAEVRYNRIEGGTTGISATYHSAYPANVRVHHNLIYSVTGRGVLVSASTNQTVTIDNNTVHTSGDGVRVQNASSDVLLKNNILWTTGGYAVYVATNSQQGFSSDYNNLFSSGTGKVAWFQKDFADLFDWQVEADFDGNSIGYTSLAPALDQPFTAGQVTAGDFRLPSGSSSIDAGDPTSAFSAEAAPNGGRVNLGAYGNTALDAASPGSFLQLEYPNFYTDWLASAGKAIRWRAYNLAGTVSIDVFEQGVSTPIHIATVPASTGSYGWSPASSGLTGDSTRRYSIRVTSDANSSILDESREKFAVPPSGTNYFVDDSSNTSDEYTSSAVGSNRSTGRTAADPKANLLPLLRNYDLEAGDIVSIDTGSYIHVRNVVLSGEAGVGDDEGATFRGPADPAKVATIDRANSNANATNIDLNNADFTTLSNLTLAGGERGLWVRNSSTNFNGSNLTLRDNAREGLLMESDASASSVDRLTAFNNGDSGIEIRTSISALRDSTAYNNGTYGIHLYQPGTIAIERNVAYGNQYGIYVYNYNTPGTATIGSTNLSSNNGNRVYNNSLYGIYGFGYFGNVTIAGNTVYGQSGSNDVGIYAQYVNSVEQNIVYGNYRGIEISESTARFNRVYNNSEAGIRISGADLTSGNVVYSNDVGILASGTDGVIQNNLSYANVSAGIRLSGATKSSGGPGWSVANNTVYQPTGAGIEISNLSDTIALKNNIVQANAGAALSVSADSQVGFASDYNLLYATGSGKVGFWQGAARATLNNWQNAAFTDQNSLSQDPLFVDPDGASNALGYISHADDGSDDDFHLQSQHGSFKGGSLAPARGGVSGLPEALSASESNDAQTSPAIDRGEPASSFSNEPSPNGNFINLGSDGNTNLASRSPAQYVLTTRPDGGETWPAGQSFALRWRSHDALGTVDMDLLQEGNPVPIAVIADDTANDGELVWAIPTSLPAGGDYRVRVTRGALTDSSNFVFAITAPVSNYYVNDNSTTGDSFTSAVGNDANDGLSPATPKASIRAVLEAYDLGSDDTILVDNGAYVLDANVIITSGDSGVTIEGPSSGVATLNRNNPGTGAFTIELQNADDVTLRRLSITGGNYGVVADSNSDSDNLVLDHCRVYGNNQYGIALRYSNDFFLITGCEVYGLPGGASTDNQGYGFDVVGSSDGIITGNIVSHNDYGIYAGTTSIASVGYRGARTLIDANQVSSNRQMGVYVYGYNSDRPEISTRTRVLNNVVSGNGATGIYGNGYVLIQANTVSGHTGSNDYGIQITGSDNPTAEYALVEGNRVFNNQVGISQSINTIVRGNRVFSNSTGINANVSSSDYSSTKLTSTENNLVYANAAYGLKLSSAFNSANAVAPRIRNNTIYASTGDGIRIDAPYGGSWSQVNISNNIIEVASGYCLNVDSSAQLGFSSDYNLLRTTGTGKVASWQGLNAAALEEWRGDFGFDQHSIEASPQFVDIDGADNQLGYAGGVDYSADDDFSVGTTSPTLDAGDPNTYYLGEPSSGGRANLGHTGNSALAISSPSQTVQILSPNGYEKYELGQTAPINFRSFGLGTSNTIALIDAGGIAHSDNWLADAYRTTSSSTYTLTNAVNLSGVSNPAPESVYKSYVLSASSPGSKIGYALPLPNGTYTLKLHFVNTTTSANYYKFDIKLNGTTLQSGYDLHTAAGGVNYKAVAVSFPVTITGGTGANLDLVVSTGAYFASISGIEVSQAAGGIASPTVALQYSDGGAYTAISGASAVPLDRFGRGGLNWTTGPTASANARVSAMANSGALPTDESDNPFIIANSGTDYYLNDSSITNDTVTSAPGSNANTGKSPDSPMSSLPALLEAYDLEPGDVIHVDNGNYALTRNVLIEAADSGLTIEGPLTGIAVFDRGNRTSYSASAFELVDADSITLRRISITGAYQGVVANAQVDSDNLLIDHCRIYANNQYGVYLQRGNDAATITGSEFYGLPGGNNNDNQGYGVDVSGSANTIIDGNIAFDSYMGINHHTGEAGFAVNIRNNLVYDNSGYGINVSGNYSNPKDQASRQPVVENNIVYGNQQAGIYAYGYALIRNNRVYGHTYSGSSRGIALDARNNSVGVDGTTAEGNIVYGNSVGIEIYYGALARGNTIYSNSTGVLVRANATYNDQYNEARVEGNLIYANTNQGITLDNAQQYEGLRPRITGNTIYQPVGDGLRLQNNTSGAVIRNNIIHVNTGYCITVDSTSQVDFDSDYNLLRASGSGKAMSWQSTDFGTALDIAYELGFERHSISSSPQFVDIDGADNQLGFVAGVDYGADDIFAVGSTSPTVDAGDPNSFYLGESSSGGRVNLGHTGNTVLAVPSAAQTVQVLSPNGYEKYEIGQTVPIQFRSFGLGTSNTVALIDTGSLTATDNWLPDAMQVSGYDRTTSNVSVDFSGVTDPAPAAVYRSYSRSQYGSGGIAYQLPLPDGTYSIRLHFLNTGSGVNQNKFNISVNNTLVQSNFDLHTQAGGVTNRAVTFTFPVTTSAGGGAKIELAAVAGYAILSAIEISQSASGVAAPTAALQYFNGSVYSAISGASSIALDRFGRGTFNFTAGPSQNSNARIRANANTGSLPSDTSDNPFAIVGSGVDYYINDASTANDSLTTATGNNVNTGKSPDSPMRSLSALIASYDLDAGDVIHVDNGTYTLLANVTLTDTDSGVRIEGPQSGEALLNRNNPATGSVGIELQNADNVTLRRISITGAYVGILADSASDSDNLLIDHCKVFGNQYSGIRIEITNDSPQITASEVYGIPGGTTSDNQQDGISVRGSNDALITGNLVFDNSYGITAGTDYLQGAGYLGARQRIEFNEVHHNTYQGINVNVNLGFADRALVADNAVYANGTGGGITGGGDVLVTRNRVYANTGTDNIGIILSGADALAEKNIVYSNTHGIRVGYEAVAKNNRVFNNSGYGIWGYGYYAQGGKIISNVIYSNSVGVFLGYGYQNYYPSYVSTVENNLIYGNTNQGIFVQNLSDSGTSPIRNNTIYQNVGEAIRITNNSRGLQLINNILRVDSGYCIYVDSTSQTNFSSNYNLIQIGNDPASNTGYWNGTSRKLLADWTAASGFDVNSQAGNASFVDIDGADNVLGYTTSNGGYDGGADDNFYLRKNSPAIDRGTSASAPATDIGGFAHVDDPGTVNGASIYDIGAWEFRGSSLDTTPPLLTATTPAAVFANGSTLTFDQLTLTFNEALNEIDAAATRNFELRNRGADNVFGTGDDVVFVLAPSYISGSNQVTLQVPSGNLPAGGYRLTVFSDSGTNSGMHDLSGLLIDGDLNGLEGGNYVSNFNVIADSTPPNVISSSFTFNSPPMSLDFQFSEDVQASVSAGDLLLQNLTTGATISTGNLVFEYVAGNTLTFRFPGYSLGDLPDGNYLAMLPAAAISDAAGNAMAGDHQFSFYVLNGDANRDRKVDTQDFNLLVGNYGRSSGALFSDADFSRDGAVSSLDFNVLVAQYGKLLPSA